MGRYCSQCGSQVRQGAVYCVGCGAILSSDPPTRPISLFPFGNNSFTSSYASREVAFEKKDINTICVSCRVLNIEVLSTESNKIQITWDESGSCSVSTEQSGDSLRITEQSFFGLHSIPDLFNLNQRKELRIELPQDYDGALILENETGAVTVSDLETKGRIALKTTTGHIKAKKITTQDNFQADTTSGSLYLSDIDTAQTVRLSSMIMGMQAEKIKAGIGFSAASSNGRCQFRDIEAAEYFSVTGSVGQVVMDAIRAAKIDVGLSGSGLVEGSRIFAENAITITSSTGSIICDIDDEEANFTAHCRSVHGRCNIPETLGNGSKLLRISTSVGNIEVRFKEAQI